MSATSEHGPQAWDEWGYPSPWGGGADPGGTEPAEQRLAWEEGLADPPTGEDSGADLAELGELGALEWLETAPAGQESAVAPAEEPEAGLVPEAEEELAEAQWLTAPEVAEAVPEEETEVFEVEMLEAGDQDGDQAPVPQVESEAFPSGLTLPVRAGTWPEGSEHWDPNATGLPLYEIPTELHRRKLAPNFTVKELASSGGQTAELARISPQLVRLLQQVRDRVARPVVVRSGYRSWARNVALYRSRGATPTRSRHCSGQAADIAVRGLSGLQLAQAAIDAGGPDLAVGMGIGRDYLHLDVRGSWVLWTYLGSVADAATRSAITEYRARAGAGAGVRGAGGGAGAGSGAAAQPTPSGVLTRTPDRLAGRVRYEKATSCLTRVQRGARACADQWTRLTGRRAGILNCRPIRNDPANGWSVHSEGRAIDAYADADQARQRAQAEAYVAWLQANAVELQCTYIIWDERQWSWGKRAQGWRPYRPGRRTKTTLHRDHIHIELTWEGSRHPSPLWGREVPNWPG